MILRITLVLLAGASFAQAQSNDRPVRGAVTDPGVVTTRQAVTPAGVATVFQGKVWGVTFGAQASDIWVLTASQLYRMDWRANTIRSNIAHKGQPGLLGVATAQGGRTFLSASIGRKSGLFEAKADGLAPIAEALGSHNAGGVAIGGNVAVVPLPFDNKAAVVDLSTSKVRGFVNTGIAPFAAVMNASGTVAYVSNWGGRKPKPSDRTAPTGLDPQADRVAVDAAGIAASGTIVRVDLQAMRVTDSIETGLHPNGIAWDERGGRLYVANNNKDSVTVIDTTNNRVIRTFELQPFARKASGIAPTAVALNASGSKLYVACGGINAVMVIDTRSGRSEGMIPTGWYPNSVAISPDGAYLAIGSLLGAGSGWQNEPRRRYVHANRGSVNVVALPDAAQLARYTAAVAENNRLPLAGSAPEAPPVRAASAKAVPVRAGDPSLIQHVVYIVKENRTYDQLFGDLAKGNGEPSFVMFGEDSSPNQRKLANQFVLLDNFYASGGNSADGHQWLTQANEVAYTMWPGYQGRSYPFDGSDPLGIAQGGTIWDAALAAGKTVRIYGEYAGRLATPSGARAKYLERWKQGDDFSREFNTVAPVDKMNAVLAKNFPSYTTNVPDVARARIFLKDLAEWNREGGAMPNLTVIQLPSDHTNGATPGASTPKAMVADNDLAVGQIVDALSHSRFWPKMAIFIVEDDAQNGVDHVDGHRTVALAVSPHIRRGHVDSTFYSHPSMLKTMELMLGLGPLSLFDLIATDMRESFQDAPDLSPFNHVVPAQDLFAVNPPIKALRGSERRAAIESAKMRWDVPDAAPTAKLNRILWHAVKGTNKSYPHVRNAVFAPMSVDLDDDERDEEGPKK